MANCIYYHGECTAPTCVWKESNNECRLKGSLVPRDVRGEDGALLQLSIVKTGHRYSVDYELKRQFG